VIIGLFEADCLLDYLVWTCKSVDPKSEGKGRGCY